MLYEHKHITTLKKKKNVYIYIYMYIQCGSERMQHLYDQSLQENEGQNEKVVCIIAYNIIFPARWNKDR